MARTKAFYKSVHKYRDGHYDRLEILIPAGTKEQLREYAKNAGAKSLPQWLMGLIEKETGIPLVLRGELPYLKANNTEQKDGAE